MRDVGLVSVVITTFAALVLGACGNKKKNDEPTGAPTRASDATATAGLPADAAAPAPPAESDCMAGKVTTSVADRHECTVDEDCIPTCAWGAVNYRASILLGDDCDDGCAGPGTFARCEQGACKTLDHKGNPIPSCNDVATPEDVCVDQAIADAANQCKPTDKLVPTWSRFRCKADADCVTSCMYGAINKPWYARLGDGCEDGCASKGMHARCIADQCVAFDYDGKRVDRCTRKPAPDAVCVPK